MLPSQCVSPDGYKLRNWSLSRKYLTTFYGVAKADGEIEIKSRDFNPGLLTGGWYWDRKYECFRTIRMEFDDAELVYNIDAVPGMDALYWVPMNRQNLLRVLAYEGYPDLEPGDREFLAEELARWSVVPTLGALHLMEKMQTQNEEGKVHRIPGTFLLSTEKQAPSVEDLLVEMFTGKLPPPVEKVVQKFEKNSLYDELQRVSPFKLYSQQIVAASLALRTQKSAALLDMRTGKTFALSSAANLLLDYGIAKVVFVICPVTNLGIPWTPTIQAYKWHAHILDGSQEEDEQKLSDLETECYALNYERLGSRMEAIEKMIQKRDLRPHEIVVILDETSAIKNPMANRTKAAHELCWRASWVWLANGTPLEQGPQDIWAQWACLDPFGLTWGSTFSRFCGTWLDFGDGGWRTKSSRREEYESILSLRACRYLRIEADQYSGQDKTFRYIGVPPTDQQVRDTQRAIEGFVEEQKRLGNVTHEIPNNPLSMNTHLREICCGYNKIPIGTDDKGHNVYKPLPYKMDAKILWLEAWLQANPTQSAVIYAEFHQQQVMVKDMLDAIGQSYVAIVPEHTRLRKYRLSGVVSRDFAYRLAKEVFFAETLPGVDLLAVSNVILPDWMCIDERILAWTWRQRDHARWLEQYDEIVFKNADHSARKEAIDAFNEGRVQHFLIAPLQGKGIPLHRKQAVANGRGVRPTMFYLNPVWSLGIYQQSQDRCVDSDEDGKSTNTMIYHLYIRGSLEEKVLKALRAKKKVQETLLKDIDRDGFTSFTEDIIADMQTASQDKSLFDVEEMQSRIEVGLSPTQKKLTWSMFDKALRKKFKLDKSKDLTKWLENEAPLAVAAAVKYLREVHSC